MQIVQYDIFHCVIAGLEHGVQIVGAVQSQFLHKSFPLKAHLDAQQLFARQFGWAAVIFLQLIDFIVSFEGNGVAVHDKTMPVYFSVFAFAALEALGQFGLFEQTDQLGKVGIIAEP